MKIPKYIDEALKRRANAAYKLIKYDCIISDYYERYNVDKLSEDEFVDLIGGISNKYKKYWKRCIIVELEN